MSKVYKLRTVKGGPQMAFTSHVLGVPEEIASLLRENNMVLFSVHLTEEGILYRPVQVQPPTLQRPSWLRPVQEEVQG